MDPYAGNTSDPQSLHKYLYCHANPVNGIDPSGREFNLITTLKAISIRILTFGMSTTTKGMIFRAVAATALQYPIAYYTEKILTPLIAELKTFSDHLRYFNASLSNSVTTFAQELEWAKSKNMFFFSVAPLTAQLPVIHGLIMSYRTLDFFHTIATIEQILLQGVAYGISTIIKGVSVNASFGIKLHPNSWFDIAKGLASEELVPADDVRVADDILMDLRNLELGEAKLKWLELIKRVMSYGQIEGHGEIEVAW